MKTNYFESPYSKLWVQEGVLHFIYKPIPLLDLSIAREVVSGRLQFQRGISYPVLCDTRGIVRTAKDARDYLAHEGSLMARAVAIIDDRRVAVVMQQFYLSKNRPEVPTRVFSDKAEALEFLRDYLG